MTSPKKLGPVDIVWLSIVLIAGVAARFWFGTLGHNYDFDSWRIATDLLAQGKSVYAGTGRYNYGPVWFNILHVLDLMAGHNPEIFRWLLIGFLTLVDIGIALVLLRKFGRLAATLFFLNPVSLMITGFHNQFDNLAVLLGLWSVLQFGDEFEKPLDRRKFSALAILGLSLMTKHLLFVFPFWLAVKQRGLLQKFFIVAVPTALFFGSFLPYWSAGHDGIVANVFEYRSVAGAFGAGYSGFFYNELLPELFKWLAGATAYWLLFLVFFAFVCRAKNSLDSLLLYTGVLVVFSPAITNQYLAIPMALVCAAPNLFSLGYLIFAGLHIAVFVNGPHLFKNTGGRYDDLAIFLLLLSLVWQLWRRQLLGLLQHCRREINRQLGQGD